MANLYNQISCLIYILSYLSYPLNQNNGPKHLDSLINKNNLKL